MRILGIESSCDETGAAIVDDGTNLISNVIASSVDLHIAYGGVVPEIAARSHVEVIMPTVNQAIADAKTNWDEIDAIAVTYGPGLGGSLIVGVMTAKALALANHKPLIPVNHVMAHPYAAFITSSKLNNILVSQSEPQFPVLALIVSGGHTQLVLFKSHFDYLMLGQTQDDAIGEAYDKVAKIIGLPYPGGPNIAKAAESGNPAAIKLPLPKMQSPYDFSYSGLKTAVLRAVQELCGKSFDFPSFELPRLLNESQQNDISASFQYAAVKQLVNKTTQAFEEFKPKSVVVAGGVAANTYLRQQLDKSLPINPFYPDIKLCTDNAAMIASLGYYFLESNQELLELNSLEANPSLSM